MKNIKKLGYAISTAVLAFSSVLAIGFSLPAHAASCTWTGGGSATNYNFSNAANWSGCSGSGGVPGNGDVININNTSSNDLQTQDDISNLSLGGINITGSKSVTVLVGNGNTLTLTGNVISTNTDSNESTLDGNVTLGANITVQNVMIGTNNGTTSLSLGGNTLTFSATNNYSTTAIGDDITGSGGLTIDVGPNAMYLDGNNNYSGTTTILSSSDTSNLSGDNSLMFGSSNIVVGPNATLSLHIKTATSFTNGIAFQAASLNNNVYGNQLMVWNDTGGASNFAIPHITLQGNSRFGTNDTGGTSLVVNLAGITANGHCVQYGDANNSGAANFQNGPTACVVAGSTARVPGTPKTGLAIFKSNPALIAGIAVLAAGSVAIIAKKTGLLSIKR